MCWSTPTSSTCSVTCFFCGSLGTRLRQGGEPCLSLLLLRAGVRRRAGGIPAGPSPRRRRERRDQWHCGDVRRLVSAERDQLLVRLLVFRCGGRGLLLGEQLLDGPVVAGVRHRGGNPRWWECRLCGSSRGVHARRHAGDSVARGGLGRDGGGGAVVAANSLGR